MPRPRPRRTARWRSSRSTCRRSTRSATRCALGRPAEAAEQFRRAAELKPGLALLRLNLAGALRDSGRLDEALEACERGISLAPRDAAAHRLLGLVLRGLGRDDEALASFERALHIDPADAESHHAAAHVRAKRGEAAAAEAGYRRALELRPDDPEALCDLGELERGMGRLDAALETLSRAAQLRPDFALAHARLAQACADLGRPEPALVHFERALALHPCDPALECGAGNALRALGRFNEAAAAYASAARHDSGCADAWCNLSTVCLDRGMTEAAADHARRAIAARPDLAEAHWNLAQALLTLGDFAQGWRKYEYRLLRRDAKELAFPWPVWDGAPLAGRTLFVTAEQGVGDEIMFASCLPDVMRDATSCVVECDARLVPLYARSFPGATYVERLAAADRYPAHAPSPDARLAIGSLPLHYREALADFPARRAYVVPDPARVAEWRGRFAALGPGLKVGISWRGGREALTRRARSQSLADWAAFGSLPGVQLVDLQYGDTAAERDAARRDHGLNVHHWNDADPLTDLDGLAAEIAALDLVISVDNATVHMAGAVGTATWAMLPVPADWRWQAGREDSPWYASVRLFRQSRADDWAPVFGRVRAELARLAAGGPGASAGAESGAGAAETATPAADAGPSPSRARPRRTEWVGLVNDTSHWYHWGCSGTSRGLGETLEQRGYTLNRIPITGLYTCTEGPGSLEEFDDPGRYRRFTASNAWLFRELDYVDHVVVNGEGSLHGDNGYVRNLLYLAYIAKTRLGKDVQIINHSCYPDRLAEASDSGPWRMYRKVYEAIDFVALRDPLSHGLMTRAGVDAVRSFDCLPLTITRHFAGPTARRHDELVLAGSVALRGDDAEVWGAFVERMTATGMKVRLLMGASMLPAIEDVEFARLLAARVPRGLEVVDADSLDTWLGTIARAAVLVSGRFHYTIAAATLGTPYVLLESNTPKNVGLAAVLESPAPVSLDSLRLSDELAERAGDAIGGRGDYARGPRPDLAARLCADAMQNFLRLPPRS
jgi:tetratricopeptide (TPR) repeat protein